MSDPIRRITVEQFGLLVAAAQLRRRITEVHLHHTWRPRRADFRGLATIEAMRRFHVETNHWADIAQHLTIDPSGGLWTGRNWNLAPASSSGANGTRDEGPFMIEMVGDFDLGQDPFDGEQRDAAIAVVARLLQQFELAPVALRFHRHLNSPKSCPGTGIDYDTIRAAVGAAVEAAAGKRPRSLAAEPLFAARHLAGFPSTRTPPTESNDPAHAEVPETEAAARAIDQDAHARTSSRQFARALIIDNGRASRGDDPDPKWNALKPHVVNLSRGELSEGGAFATRPEDIDAIVESIRTYAAAKKTPRVMLYAHGGLVSEELALEYAKTVYPWWLDHGVYPVFFIWESGLLEILRQYIVGPRDFADWTSDPAIEIAIKAPGSLVWGGMKESARRAASPDAGEGYPGGALMFARAFAKLVPQIPDLSVHAAGHSAGAIFHAQLLPRLIELGVKIETLCLMAPAARTELFKEKLLRPLREGQIRKLSLFTMHDEAERQDSCLRVYRKSLLYLASRSFEGVRWRPLLGLHRSLRKDEDLAALFGLRSDGVIDPSASPDAELQLSYPPGDEPNELTQALEHGDFDNDPKTMAAVLRRVLQVDDKLALGEVDFPYRLVARVLDLASLAPAREDPPLKTFPAASGWTDPGTASGRKLALCIGIDEYATRPLAGCVNDARAWLGVLEQLGFEVKTLFDAQATREGIVRELGALVARASPKDIVVFQYAGHGTQLPDDDGDEIDAFDEAFVPIDYDQGRFLLDDDIAVILARLPAGVTMTLFMDCCHSGTNSRFAPLVAARSNAVDRARFLPTSATLVEAHRAFRTTIPSSASRATDESLPGVVHFAACMDNEYSWESQGHGDFTTAATQMLAAAVSRGDTNEDFAAATRQTLGARGRQHPQLMRLPSGMSGRRLLS